MADKVYPIPEFASSLPIPAGWEERINNANGRKYYANLNTQTTTYDDPRFLPLPRGWEMKWDSKKNKPYFSDFNTKTTTYNDPRVQHGNSPTTAPPQRNTNAMTAEQRRIAQMMQGGSGGSSQQMMQGGRPGGAPMQQMPQQRPSVSIFINGKLCTEQEIQILRRAGSTCIPGRYWYDHKAGGFGYEGGPCLMWGTPGLKVGGPLQPNASNGTTGVFINGRQLHVQDVMNWNTYIGPVC